MRNILLAVCMLFGASKASAAIWTDLWWNPAESGWGVTITQQGNAMFLTYFVYAADGSARWYTATVAPGAMQPNGYSVWNGDMYETRGPWFGGAFNPALVQARKVGVMTFAPATFGTGSLSYSVDGVVVSKAIQRQTFRHINLGGSYLGVYRIAVSTCPGFTIGVMGLVALDITATVSADGATGNITTALAFDDVPICTLVGNYRQYGAVYQVNNIAACGSALGSINFSDLGPTDEGLEGNMTITGVGNCRVGLNFTSTRAP